MNLFLRISFLIFLGLSACAPKQSDVLVSNQNDGSIIGGQPAKETDAVRASTVAIMRVLRNKAVSSYCSGTLISKNLIITAAHCVEPMTNEKLYVYFGETLPMIEGQENLVKIEKLSYHPQYQIVKVEINGDSYDATINDIALIRIQGEAPEGFSPVPILADTKALLPGKPLLLAGYGVVNDVTNRFTEVLNYALGTLHKIEGDYIITDQSRGQGACRGDSGGPVYLETSMGLVVAAETHGAHGESTDCHHYAEFTLLSKFREYVDKAVTELGGETPTYIGSDDLK